MDHSSSKSHISKFLRQECEQRDLEFLGVVQLAEEANFAFFAEWLSQGKHAGMEFLEKNQDLRRNPKGFLAGAKSVIAFALPYYLGDKYQGHGTLEVPRIAQYARLKDYHRILRRKGEELMMALHQSLGGDATLVGRVLVDSAPLLERAIAQRTSRGFIGKNTCYIHPEKGSFLLLGEIITSAELPFDQKVPVDPGLRTADGGCGSCRRCQVFCPTGALDREYQLDANLCLAYWTIEHRGPIPERFWPWLKDYYFGCDICQLVCPYNRSQRVSTSQRDYGFGDMPTLSETAIMNQDFYERRFGGTPLTRAKRFGLRRNALIALAVTKSPELQIALSHVRADDHPTLLETAIQIRNWVRDN